MWGGGQGGVALRVCVVLGLLAGPAAAEPVDTLLPLARSIVREHPGMWVTASVVRGRHAVVVGTPPALVAELAVLADRAAGTVTTVWAGPVDAVILVPGTTEQAATLAAPTRVAGLAALAGEDRIIIEPSGFARLSRAGRQIVITHELTHLTTRAAASERVPTWLAEGFADYLGFRDSGLPVRTVAAELAAELATKGAPRSLPGPAEFQAGSPRRAQAYQEAWLVCRLIAERFGERRLVALYRAARRVGITTALIGALGVTADDLTRRWRAYLLAQLGAGPEGARR